MKAIDDFYAEGGHDQRCILFIYWFVFGDMAYGIFVPQAGIKLKLRWKNGVLTTEPAGKSQEVHFRKVACAERIAEGQKQSKMS